MLKTNLKLAFRNIFRNKLYSAINIIGLGVASAFCILVYLYIKNEQSFDTFHKDGDRLFRVEISNLSLAKTKPEKSIFSFLTKESDQKNLLVTPPVMALDLKRNFPEIEDAVRLYGFYDAIVHIGNSRYTENNNVTYADANFFKVFNFPLISGNPATILSERGKVAISERLAHKYFGKADPIGRVVAIEEDGNLLLTVAGVFKNSPQNSSLNYDMVVPIETDPDYRERIAGGLGTSNMLLILKLKLGTNFSWFENKLYFFGEKYFSDQTETDASGKVIETAKTHIILRPFSDAHNNVSEGWGHYTNVKIIYQLACLALIILFIACLNYVLLTLTNTMSNSQDVGVRKTLGAGKLQIVLQYYIQTQLLAIISVTVGLLIAVSFFPFFNNLMGSELQLSFFSVGQIIAMMAGLSIVLGLIAGIYPALAMSGLKPLNIMRSFSAYKLNPVLSRGLVIFQFTICVVFIISSLAINKQMSFVNQSDMGFDKDQVLLLKSPFSWSDKAKNTALKNELYQFVSTQCSLAGMTATSFNFGGGETNGYVIGGQKMMLQQLNIDYNYFSFNKIPILQGRAFSKDISTDSIRMSLPELEKNQKHNLALRHVVVNQTLYNMLGKPQLNVINSEMGGIIIGICKDYHNQDFTKKIMPAYHIINRYVPAIYWIRIKAGKNIPLTIEKIKGAWDQLTDNMPFNYTFIDQEVAKSYEVYLRWMKTITISCVLAIIVACLGLFGLSGITTINRTKEIGIRKVLGASVTNLFLLLSRGTFIIALGSFAVAMPVAFYFVHQWLDNFAYRITPDWTLFALSAIISLLAAILAVSYHTLKAALANPTRSLRSE